jgi:hypothetical protein
MNHADASYHIDHLQRLGFRKGLLAEGWMMKDGVWITNFQAGPIMIEAISHEKQPVSSDYAVIYSSWDGQRRQDVSDLSEEEFVQYMLSQPKSLGRALKVANG